MPAELHDFLSRDHERLDALLADCRSADGPIPNESYDLFRRGLLRHIAIEERVLFPELRKQRGVTELERQLHRDHAAICALLVPPPTHVEIEQIATILTTHNVLEESSDGLYEIMETLAAEELPRLIEQVHAVPEVRVAPHSDTAVLRRSIEHFLREADEGRERFLRSQRR